MSSGKCRIADIGVVSCTNERDNRQWRTPNPVLFSNIPLLWQFLDLTVQDWMCAAAPFQARIDSAATENEKMIQVSQVFIALQPHYLKCLFSYVMFFVALEHAYDLFYKDLNALNRKPFFHVRYTKRPKRSTYIDKVKMIRNISIAHLESEKVSKLDSAAGMMWQPMVWKRSMGESWSIDGITFGAGRLVSHDPTGKATGQSTDLEVDGIPELHKACTTYLDGYDLICAQYLSEIMAKLPITADDTRYYSLRT